MFPLLTDITYDYIKGLTKQELAILLPISGGEDSYIQHVNSMTPVDLSEMIKLRFVDGGYGEMKAEGMVNYVFRRTVGCLLSEGSVTPPRDVATRP